MDGPGPPTNPHSGWRRPRRYSPFHRSPGLRHVPDDAIAFAFVGSLFLHIAFATWLVQATHAPSWVPGATMSFIDLADPRAEEPVAPPAPASDPSPSPPPPSQPLRSTPAARSVPGPNAEAGAVAIPSVATSMPVSGSSTAGGPAPGTVFPILAEEGPGPALVAAVPETPLDAGPPEPPSTGVPIAATPARALIPVPVVPSLSSGIGAGKPSPTLAAHLPPTAARPSEVIGSAPPVPPAAAVPPSQPLAASPLGLGLGPARVQLDGPRERTIDRPAEIVTGKLVGGRVRAARTAGTSGSR